MRSLPGARPWSPGGVFSGRCLRGCVWSVVPVPVLVWSVVPCPRGVSGGAPGPAPGGVWWGGHCPPQAVGGGFCPSLGPVFLYTPAGQCDSQPSDRPEVAQTDQAEGQDAPHENWGVPCETSGETHMNYIASCKRSGQPLVRRWCWMSRYA